MSERAKQKGKRELRSGTVSLLVPELSEFPWRDSRSRHISSRSTTLARLAVRFAESSEKSWLLSAPVTNTTWPSRPTFLRILTVTSRLGRGHTLRPGPRKRDAVEPRCSEEIACRGTKIFIRRISSEITPSFILSVRFTFWILRQ